jgi:Chaperone of endosialidase
MKPNTFSLVLFALLTYFAGTLGVEALSPAPEGGYANFTTAEGTNALLNLTTGAANTGVGWYSLWSNTDGSFNTGVGAGTLLFNVGNQSTFEGVSNTAIGAAALLLNATGSENTAVGTAALANNDASDNAAFGAYALQYNTGGQGNTAIGHTALRDNTNGNFNTAIGNAALLSNTMGFINTAIGDIALQFNTTGYANVALGYGAGINVSTAHNVVCISSGGDNVDSTTWIGNIYGVTTQSGTTAPVVVSDTGQLGTVASSERFKKDIATMEKASEAILSLRPVTFHYKTDTKAMPQFGLVAEEVAKVNPALVLPDKEGKPYTVRYDAVNAMLLNEFLKEYRKVEKLEAMVAQQHKDFETALADLKGQIQRVSAQLEMSKAAPQTVQNSQ